MKKVQIEFDELPFSTLERFGLTREMIEDLPMRVLEDICNGRHSPVLPVRVTDEHGGQIESRSRFAFIRMDDGQVDVVFYPALKSSPLERYDEAQQKQLLDGKAIVADVEMSDGRSSKAFVQIDAETKQVMYVPTPIIARNLKVLAEVMRLGTVEVNGMQHGEPLTVVVGGEPATVVRATRSNGATNPSESGTNTPSGATAAGSWTMTVTLTTFRRKTTPKSCGTNRRRAASAIVRQLSISKTSIRTLWHRTNIIPKTYLSGRCRAANTAGSITSIISPPTGRRNTPVTARKKGLQSATNPPPSSSASRTNSWRQQWKAETHNENNQTMAIRTNTNPRQMDLQPEMRDRLIAQGHDSPLPVYPITERQMLALTDWGTNTANKKAYNVLTSIVGKDFYMPKNFVHARNANGRVAMGLHGYRIVIGEYGHVGRLGMPPPFLGWTPRHQWGFHLRRVGGQLFFPGPSIVPERPDGRMKPGELQSGGYGFYYKGHQQEQPVQQRDVLQDLQAAITPMVSRPRSKEPARPYKELIASPVYFSNEKWAECLASHGLVVDAEKQTLTVQSESVQADMVYDLTEEEVRTLGAAPIEEQPVEKRLELLNGIIGADFSDKVTMEALNSDQRIAIGLHPEVQQDLKQRQRQEQEAFMPVKTSLQQQEESVQGNIGAVVDGRDLQFLNENKGWYREEKHGREVEVSQIAVQPAQT